MEDTAREQVVAIATMQTDIAHLKNAFDEYKIENKEYHETQAQKFDDLFEEIRNFTRLTQEFLSLQRQVNELHDEQKAQQKDIDGWKRWRERAVGVGIALGAVLTVGEALLAWLSLKH